MAQIVTTRPKVLVCGGAGFVGSCFVRMLVSAGLSTDRPETVTVLDKLTYSGNLANLAPVKGAYDFVCGDIGDAELLTQVVRGHDLVINFAAETNVDKAIADASEFMVTNALGTQTLMQACLDAGVGRVVQISTEEVYGSFDTDEGSWSEDALIAPTSPYSASKAGGDLIALAYARTHGLNVVVTRCSNNYGPYQYPEKVIPLFVTNLLEGKKVPLYGDGKNRRDWLHVEDHCRGIQLVAERGTAGAVYHIAGSLELSNIELTGQLLSTLGMGWDMVEWVADRKGHDRRYSLDDARLRALGFAPRIDFREGLARTIHWYAANPDWWKPLKAS